MEEDQQQKREIDALLVPGMTDLKVKEALEKAAGLCAEMRESAEFCGHLLERLLFLREQLPTRMGKVNSDAAHGHSKAEITKEPDHACRFFPRRAYKRNECTRRTTTSWIV